MHRRSFLNHGIRATLAIGVGLPSVFATPRKPSGVVGQDPNIATTITDIEKLIPDLLKISLVPGMSIALVHDGKRAWSRGFGVCDIASGKPIDADTVFECASVSKTVFAYTVMKLCEQGVMNLDTPLVKYGVPPIVEGDERSAQITARHILSHQSGIQNWRSPNKPLKFHFDPGKGFMYSGEGYFYLQSVVTLLRGKTDTTQCGTFEADVKVCATDIGSFLQQRVLEPMGMTSSSYISMPQLRSNYALPHDEEGKNFTKAPQTSLGMARYASAGGLLTTANDYAKFIIGQFEPKEKDNFRLNKESQGEMQRPHVKLPPDQLIDGASSWALGWAIQERKEGNVVLHSGGHAGYMSLAMLSPTRRSGFVMLTNCQRGGRILYDEELRTVLNRLLPA